MFERIARRDRRRIFYIRVISGVPTVISRKWISARITQAGLKGKPFPFDIEQPAYRVKNIFYYFVDVSRGQLFLYDKEEKIAPELLDSVITRQVAKQLVAGLESPLLGQYLSIILMAMGMGGAIGYIIGNVFPIG